MQYTDIQLEAIKLFGRKDLTEGCISIEKDGTLWKCDVREEWRTINLPEGQRNVTSSKMEGEILGHIPNLEDLFRVADEQKKFVFLKVYSKEMLIFTGKYETLTYNQTLPLLDQPSLPDILNLFK